MNNIKKKEKCDKEIFVNVLIENNTKKIECSKITLIFKICNCVCNSVFLHIHLLRVVWSGWPLYPETTRAHASVSGFAEMENKSKTTKIHIQHYSTFKTQIFMVSKRWFKLKMY